MAEVLCYAVTHMERGHAMDFPRILVYIKRLEHVQEDISPHVLPVSQTLIPTDFSVLPSRNLTLGQYLTKSDDGTEREPLHRRRRHLQFP